MKDKTSPPTTNQSEIIREAVSVLKSANGYSDKGKVDRCLLLLSQIDISS